MHEKFAGLGERFIFPGVILICCLILWQQLDTLPLPRFEPMGAALFPKFVLGAIALLTIFDVAMECFLRSRRAPSDSAAPAPAEASHPVSFSSRIMPVVATAGLVAYMLLLSWTDLPYIPLTFLFVLLQTWYLGHFRRKALIMAVLLAGLVTGIIYVIFGIFLEAFFP